MSNAKPVFMTVYSVIKMAGEEDQIMELSTEGKFYEKNDSRYYLYEESELSGMKGDRTMVKVSADGSLVTMHRYGQNNSELSFQEGVRYTAAYSTPYGPFEMEVLASKVETHTDDQGNGTIVLSYALSIKGIGETQTEMKITSKAVVE